MKKNSNKKEMTMVDKLKLISRIQKKIAKYQQKIESEKTVIESLRDEIVAKFQKGEF